MITVRVDNTDKAQRALTSAIRKVPGASIEAEFDRDADSIWYILVGEDEDALENVIAELTSAYTRE